MNEIPGFTEEIKPVLSLLNNREDCKKIITNGASALEGYLEMALAAVRELNTEKNADTAVDVIRPVLLDYATTYADIVSAAMIKFMLFVDRVQSQDIGDELEKHKFMDMSKVGKLKLFRLKRSVDKKTSAIGKIIDKYFYPEPKKKSPQPDSGFSKQFNQDEFLTKLTKMQEKYATKEKATSSAGS